MRENGTIGKKGKSLLHFFYTFVLLLAHLAAAALVGYSRRSANVERIAPFL